jgi:hypothetical protein
LVGSGECVGSVGLYVDNWACGVGRVVVRLVVRLFFLGGWLVDEAGGGVDIFRLFCLLCLFRLAGVLVLDGAVIRDGAGVVCCGEREEVVEGLLRV